MSDNPMRTWALKGAEQRLLEIGQEASAIYAAFPELRDQGNVAAGRRGPGRPRKNETSANGTTAPGRRKRTMSADARKRISEAQKARWAKQKGAADAATASGTATALKPSRKSGRKKR